MDATECTADSSPGENEAMGGDGAGEESTDAPAQSLMHSSHEAQPESGAEIDNTNDAVEAVEGNGQSSSSSGSGLSEGSSGGEDLDTCVGNFVPPTSPNRSFEGGPEFQRYGVLSASCEKAILWARLFNYDPQEQETLAGQSILNGESLHFTRSTHATM